MKYIKALKILFVILLIYCTLPTSPQRYENPYHKLKYELHSGLWENCSDKATLTFQKTIQIDDAQWLQLHFDSYNLGENSYLLISSILDNGSQYHNTKSLKDWNDYSAFFNGRELRIELYVAPFECNVFFNIDKITVGEQVEEIGAKSLCGDDDRITSSDDRVGRLFIGGCTASLASNGTLLTAGHCVDYDPDGFGSQLPDGILDLWGVVEFDVPASSPNGSPVAADPNDQYPINLNSVVWNYDGEGEGLGKDWAIFECNPNSNTGLLPHHGQGTFFRMTTIAPSINNTIRITGCGADSDPPGPNGGSNSNNFTQQTSIGPFYVTHTSGNDIWYEYSVDTQGGNSGGPIILESINYQIGIHTNGGCNPPWNGNNGTSFDHNPLEEALHTYPGLLTVYVDNGTILPGPGTVFNPYMTISNGVLSVIPSGKLSIVKGSYNESITINKAMTIEAPVGIVNIGQ